MKQRARHNYGFTLIELLVVISIIGFLSSIVLASLKSVRLKADNSARTQTMQQYVLALTMLIGDKGTTAGLTSVGSGNLSEDLFCIGEYPSDTCMYGGSPSPTDTILNNNFRVYFPSLPILKPTIQSDGTIWNSPLVGCGVYDSLSDYWDIPPLGLPGEPPCTPILKWEMQGENQPCLPGAQVEPSYYSGITVCLLPVPYF